MIPQNSASFRPEFREFQGWKSQPGCPLLRQDRCLLLRQDRCLLLRQDRCLLLRQDRCLLLRQDRCLLLQYHNGITMFKSQMGGLALNRRKWPEMGPEWSPGPENRSPGFSRPFSRVWDRSRGPKPPKYSPNSRSTAPSGRYVTMFKSQIGVPRPQQVFEMQ